jgi:tetratricopeptide (TPR) repeat protein
VLLDTGLYKASLGQDPLRDFLAAEQDFSRALERDKEYGDAWGGRGQVRLSRALWNDRNSPSPRSLEEYVSAVSDLEQALKLNPTLERDLGGFLSHAVKKRDAARKP